jgi:hypothetical protein
MLYNVKVDVTYTREKYDLITRILLKYFKIKTQRWQKGVEV